MVYEPKQDDEWFNHLRKTSNNGTNSASSRDALTVNFIVDENMIWLWNYLVVKL